MLADILTKEFIWNSYIRCLLLPFESLLPWVIIFVITGFIFNEILNHLYYRLMQSGNPRLLTRKKCRVMCSGYDTRPFRKNHDSYK